MGHRDADRKNAEAGAGIFAVSDSFGAAIPSTMRYLVSEVKRVTKGGLVKVHCHNGTGLALANTLGAVEGGRLSRSS